MRLGDHLLSLASRSSPVVRVHLGRHGQASLVDFLQSLPPAPAESFQSRDDLWKVIRKETTSYYGGEIAEQAVADLESDPIAPTSNHFGVDTLADSVQGTLLFSLRPRPDGAPRKTVVVLGFGSISLNNLTYPMGLLLYDPRRGEIDEMPRRLPIFPNRLKDRAVTAAGPFDRVMVERARGRLGRMRRDGEFTAFCERAAGIVFDEDLASSETLALSSYREQATRVNAGLWARMFKDPSVAARLVQLEMEAITRQLLEKDLLDRESLVHSLFFTPPVRDALLAILDGARACWRCGDLRRRLRDLESTHGRGGTVFFWGLSEDGRRIPLALEADRSELHLVGVDEHRRRQTWEFSPYGLLRALADGRLLPSLFTCFAVVAFARGFVCVGGYYQVDYLPAMQRGIAAALTMNAAQRSQVELVARVPSDAFLAGLQGIVRQLDDGAVIPAGPVEVAGAGGLTAADLAQLGSLKVREASLVAFMELFEHMVPDARLPEGWTRQLASENGASCWDLVRMTGTN